MNRASTSLPVPVSPVINTDTEADAAFAACSIIILKSGELPITKSFEFCWLCRKWVNSRRIWMISVAREIDPHDSWSRIGLVRKSWARFHGIHRHLDIAVTGVRITGGLKAWK